MKKTVAALVLAIAGLAMPRLGHAGAGAIVGIPGYYDPTTSSFVPMVIPKVQPLATVTRTGTVKITITLNIEAAIGTDQAITCQATVQASDASFDNSASATGLVNRSGATGTLTMSIPYNWTMAATGELANISVNCTEGNGFTAGSIGHSIFFTVAGFTVPSVGGTVTTKTLTASM